MIDDVLRVHQSQFPSDVAELADFCRIPSVGGNEDGMNDAVVWLSRVMTDAGIDVQVLPGEGNHPYIVGTAAGAGDRTVLCFNHYDVANYTNPIPAELHPGERPPFTGEVTGGRLYARGVADDKATLLSRIHAVRTWRKARRSLPVTVKFLLEGKRDLATQGLEGFLAKHAGLVQANACCWEAGSKDEDDRPVLTLGHKGHLYVELAVTTANRDYPSRITALPNAAWRLIWALATIKGPDESVAVPGFTEGIRASDEAVQRRLQATLPQDATGLRARTGVRGFVKGLEGPAVAQFIYSEPVATVCGITAGYVGPGHKLVMPGMARARVEFRLVPDQDPEQLLRSLRAHLDARGFQDIAISTLAATPPYSIAPNGAWPKMVADAAAATYGRDPVIVPFATGIGSRYLFRRYSPMPIVGFAIGYAGSALETSDEHIRLSDYDEGIRHMLAIFARAPELPRVPTS